MLAPEEETDAEVRREDQDRINRFARLNARAGELNMEREQLKLEALDDASNDLMMGSGDNVAVLRGGETFFETTEDDAVAFCEQQTETLQKQLDALDAELGTIQTEQAELKQVLYGRFGKSINLETD